jgi:DNA-binding MarR family transcriptional regulator
MQSKVDTAALAGDLRAVLGSLTRRLRAMHGFSVSQSSVLGRLDRDGPCSIGRLATAERVRPQSMAQTVKDLEAGALVARESDPDDGRRAVVSLTERGRATLAAERGKRDGWLADAIERELADDEQATLAQAVGLIRRLTDS